MPLKELPFPIPAWIYRCFMPFMPYDPRGDTLQAFRQRQISIIVLVSNMTSV